MTHDNSTREYLEKILNSEEFFNSSIYINYLKYLVEASESGKSVKETTIAIEVFGKDADFNPAEDTIVRSHTYTLRKKLERYYFTEGKDDKIRLRIPKGHYDVAFVKVDENKLTLNNVFYLLTKHFKVILIIILVLSLAFILYETSVLRNQLKNYLAVKPDNFIWQEIIHSTLPILVVPGDHFLYDYRSTELDRDLSVRDMLINSSEELDLLKSRFPEKILIRSQEPYFPYHSIWSLPPVLAVLFSYNKKIIMRKSSSISPQMLDEYNVVFVGSIKTLYALKHTLSRTYFDIRISPHEVIYNDPDSNKTKIYKTDLHSSGPNEDLVLALKIPGPVNNCIFIIASYHSLGAPEIANYLTSPEGETGLRDLFLNKYNTLPKFFGILFKVTGIDKTAYKTEILIYNEIATD